jgi:hypothetical protein
MCKGVKHIEYAQDINSIHYLKLDSSIYKYYHGLLIDYCKLILKHKYSPSKANKLAFIIHIKIYKNHLK